MRKYFWGFILTGLLVGNAVADTRVNVVGLFNNKAILTINGGAPQTLSAGQEKQGVKLISADSGAATFVIEGKRQVLHMGQAASVGAGAAVAGNEEGPNSPVTLFADSSGHFRGQMIANGTAMKYLVDTGATTLAMNVNDAQAAGIDYKSGERVAVGTANGVSTAYMAKVDKLKIGTITLYNVDVGVVEGGLSEVLLGMNVLSRMEMKQEDSKLTLKRKY